MSGIPEEELAAQVLGAEEDQLPISEEQAAPDEPEQVPATNVWAAMGAHQLQVSTSASWYTSARISHTTQSSSKSTSKKRAPRQSVDSPAPERPPFKQPCAVSHNLSSPVSTTVVPTFLFLFLNFIE
ncbi:uncharacterized protein LOC125946831 isoform X1 [Dermacentor silvarum]|uniref:uncharacterized protein LOC125946831 isoform X1 n=1 Tax=Dermacentor silvarum TaxID=543639 RepID=UPI002100FFC3|nr:uncharacterized protein LOC125946831 isoform X1 [Dermacentor silvarum]